MTGVQTCALPILGHGPTKRPPNARPTYTAAFKGHFKFNSVTGTFITTLPSKALTYETEWATWAAQAFFP